MRWCNVGPEGSHRKKEAVREAAIFAGVDGSRSVQPVMVAAAVVVVPRGSKVKFLMQKRK